MPSSDLGAELRLPLLHACFDRERDPNGKYRTQDPALGYRGSESFREVCNKGGVMPAGNLGWAQAFDSGWGYGIGFFTPAAVPNLEYGDDLICMWVEHTVVSEGDAACCACVAMLQSGAAWLTPTHAFGRRLL